jgi:hydroxyacylglutathione hydrolase
VPRVHTISILPFGMVNAFLVEADGALVLFDAGLPGSSKAVGRVLAGLGRNFRDLRAIVMSHAHIDHAGGVAEVQALSGAPVIVQRAELPYLQGAAIRVRPSGPFGRVFALTGVITRPAPRFVADRVIDGGLDMAEFGIPGRLELTPGHTPGSQSLVLGSGDVLAGDLAASGLLLGGIALRGRPKSPPFEEEPRLVAQSLQGLLAAGGVRFHLGHGGPLGAETIRRHAVRLAIKS